MAKFTRYNPHPGRANNTSTGEVAHAIISQPDQIPVFLIPGIFRNPREMTAVAEQLYKSYNGTRPIYIYEEANERKATTDLNDTLAALRATLPYGPIPYLLVGYSDGCRLAVNAAKALSDDGQNAQTCVIDGASPAIVGQFFNEHTSESITDIIAILNYAADLCGLDEKINLNENDIKKLINITLECRFEELSNLMEDLNLRATADNINKFLSYAEIVKHTLSANQPQENTSANNSGKAEKIIAFFTNSTKLKYRLPIDSKGGWENESDNVALATDALLSTVDHRALTTESNAARLAELINNHFLKLAITPKDLRDKLANYIDQQFEIASSKSDQDDTPSPSSRDASRDNSQPPSPTHSPVLSPRHSTSPSSHGFYAPQLARAASPLLEVAVLKK